MTAPTNIPIREEFSSPVGVLSNYDAYDPDQRTALPNQRHVDIRCFIQNDVTRPIDMLDLDAIPMGSLDSLTMQQLESSIILHPGEAWTAGAVGPVASRNHCNGLVLTCGVGTTTTSSVMAAPVDLSSMANTDVISVACPGLQVPNLTLASCFLDLSSDPAFAPGATDSLAFSASTGTTVFGDTELRFPVSSLVHVTRGAIVAVRFRIVATALTSFTCLAIRALASTYQTAPLAVQTLRQRVARQVPLNGAVAPSYSFPQATFPLAPTEWPILWRSDTTPGNADPRPIDLSVSLAFNTGSIGSGNPHPAARFNANKVTVPDSGPLDVTTVFTIEAWIKPTTLAGLSTFVSKYSGGQQAYRLSVTAGGELQLDVSSNGAATTTATSVGAAIVTNVWRYVAVRVTGGSATFYVGSGGVLTTLNTVGAIPAAFVGTSTLLLGSALVGSLAEVAIYNTALLATDLLNNCRTAQIAPTQYPATIQAFASLVGYWRLDDASVTATDRKNANNGTYDASVERSVTGPLASPDQAQDSIYVYFREFGEDTTTMLDLEASFTQATFEALGHQPDFTDSGFAARRQSDLDNLPQGALDGTPQGDLERVPDVFAAAWIEVGLIWTPTGAALELHDTEGNGYTFVLTLAASTDYILLAELVEQQIQVRICTLDPAGNIGALVFDTTVLTDDTFIKRRRGRVGWWASFSDGDAYLKNIRPYYTNFGEYRSHPLRSRTPVSGATLYVEGSPDINLFNGAFFNGPVGGTWSFDTDKSSSGQAIKVVTTGPSQGVQTSHAYFDDFTNMTISFDVLFPKTALDGDVALLAYLAGDDRIIPIGLPAISPDEWYHVELGPIVTPNQVQTGDYALGLVQASPVSATWYIDNVTISRRVLSWALRPEPDDPWGNDPREWLVLGDALNSQTSSGTFMTRGRGLQVRGQALMQSAQIAQIKAVPRYAELGLTVWPDAAPTPSVSTAVITSSNTGTVGVPVSFNGLTSTTTDTRITLWEWTFGDGNEDIGPSVAHTYAAAGAYIVILMVTDSQGQRGVVSKTVTIT